MTDFERFSAAIAERYVVERELGRGGMATVYLAHDLKHERDVAIKVLHPDLGAALGAERFLSEIKTTAKLQHPHILPLLDSGAADGLLYYVMPFVRGETLRALLEREKQLPIPDALRIAREVASALEHAHKQGIIHRDIKPENILLQDGAAVVADFGIALAVQHAGGARMTQTGLSLGTPQYMSPEQAMGERAIDARTDVFALGAVTYEMLTGEPPFTGATTQAIVARVLTERPASLRTVRDTVPVVVEQGVMQALAKLPADRFSSAGAFALALSLPNVRETVGTPVAYATRTPRGMVTAGIIACAVVSAAAGWLGRGATSSVAPTLETRFTLDFRRGEVVPQYMVGRIYAFSPDGATLVYVAADSTGQTQLYRRPLNAVSASPIENTAGALNPAFSPDGRTIAFTANGELRRIPAEGGSATRVTTYATSTVRGITWLSDRELAFGVLGSRTLSVVSSDGGAVRPLASAPEGVDLRWPMAAGDGEHVLYTEQSPNGATHELYVVSAATGKSAKIEVDALLALGVYRGELLYVSSEQELFSVPIDLATGALGGKPRRLATGLDTYPAVSIADAALSSRGDLVYRERVDASQLVVTNRRGEVTERVTDSTRLLSPRFSPDGRHVVMMSAETGTAIAIHTLDRSSGIQSNLTADLRPGRRTAPSWSADGARVMYADLGKGGRGPVWRAADGRDTESVLPSPKGVGVIEMSPDRRTMIGKFTLRQDDDGRDLWWWTVADTTAHRFTTGPSNDYGPRFSPNGKWVAYTADVNGVRQAFVAAFPGPGGRVQLTQDGAFSVVWAPDGNAVYYGQGNRIMACDVALGASPSVIRTRSVLSGDYLLSEFTFASFDVSRDGEFVLVRALRPPHTVVVRGALQ
ncbi:protein kinase domain-containing protein [Gemmatimonas groenlandica]|uniref:non-specific serine/threonine protein kinase n=1 Tax=Gemmatimonas groenlandica TaxID=2732249 RepID=A0A6M4IYF1_9BACT|nr:protein kinase [Gemmatimonas groenlandica]QJR37912.1 serine/threonine-protein kinase [Gemmatimonas groenlandica]